MQSNGNTSGYPFKGSHCIVSKPPKPPAKTTFSLLYHRGIYQPDIFNRCAAKVRVSLTRARAVHEEVQIGFIATIFHNQIKEAKTKLISLLSYLRLVVFQTGNHKI